MSIFVEIQIIDHRSMSLGGKYNKEFSRHDEFNKWYNLMKLDQFVILNIMKYNPTEKPLQNDINYAKLIQVPRENAV